MKGAQRQLFCCCLDLKLKYTETKILLGQIWTIEIRISIRGLGMVEGQTSFAWAQCSLVSSRSTQTHLLWFSVYYHCTGLFYSNTSVIVILVCLIPHTHTHTHYPLTLMPGSLFFLLSLPCVSFVDTSQSCSLICPPEAGSTAANQFSPGLWCAASREGGMITGKSLEDVSITSFWLFPGSMHACVCVRARVCMYVCVHTRHLSVLVSQACLFFMWNWQFGYTHTLQSTDVMWMWSYVGMWISSRSYSPSNVLCLSKKQDSKNCNCEITNYYCQKLQFLLSPLESNHKSETIHTLFDARRPSILVSMDSVPVKRSSDCWDLVLYKENWNESTLIAIDFYFIFLNRVIISCC